MQDRAISLATRALTAPFSIVVSATLALSTSTPSQANATETAIEQTERIAKWREDLATLTTRIPQMHPDPFFGCEQKVFEAAAKRLHDRIPNLSDDAVIVGFMRLLGLLSRSGREGHAGVWPLGRFHFLPVQLYEFKDDLYVVKAAPAHEDLIGSRVIGIGKRSTEDALAALAPVLTFDNEWSARVRRDFVILMPEVLATLDIVASTEQVLLRVQKGAAEPRAVRLKPQSAGSFSTWGDFPPFMLPRHGDPLYQSRPTDAFWSKWLAKHETLYVQFNSVRSRDAKGKTLVSFVKELRAAISDEKPRRFVVDVRLNGGGDNTAYRPFLMLLEEMRFTPDCQLYLLTSRHTFSAAGNFVTEVERRTDATLVGEPSGGAPNQYGDSRLLKLPNHPDLTIRIATRYHVKAESGDTRLVHEPDLRVELTFADWWAGKDPVLERVLRQK